MTSATSDAAIGLLRELRRGHVRQRAAGVAYWLYLGGLMVLVYGGWLVAAVVRVLRYPQHAVTDTAVVLRAEPAGLCALGLVLLAALLWDARWRGPVMVSQPTADWLLDTPVRRERLLRPRYRVSMLSRMLWAAVAGLLPAAALLAAGLSGGAPLRLAGVTALGTGLLAGFGTGVAAGAEARADQRLLRTASAVVGAAATVCAGLAAAAAAGVLPVQAGSVLLWSGPWGWAAQGVVALSGGDAPAWPLAVTLLAAVAGVAMVAGDRAAAAVPAAALRARARTLGSMSAAMANLDARRVATAYRAAAGGYGRVSFTVPVPRRRQLVLPWRDVLALARAPSRLASATVLALAAAGLGALAVRAPHSALLSLAGALCLGYLAAASLCEGARLDADDTRRSGQLPFRYDALAWWHAIVPCVLLAVLGGVPAAVLAVVAGNARLLPVVAVSVGVLVGGALVNAYRGPLEPEALSYGTETPFGNTGSISIVLWYVTGPLLAVGPLLLLTYVAVSAHGARGIAVPCLLAAALAAWLGRIAMGRARRLRGV
jgi:hypothetical protein